MSRPHLRAGAVGRLVKFFKAILSRGVRIALELTDEDDRSPVEDLGLLRTLCLVWPDGPYAQQFYSARTPDPAIAPLAAREVRKAIEASVIYDCELCLDHVLMLQRIEATLGSRRPEYLSIGSRFLRAVLARVHPWIQSIRGTLPLRSRPG